MVLEQLLVPTQSANIFGAPENIQATEVSAIPENYRLLGMKSFSDINTSINETESAMEFESKPNTNYMLPSGIIQRKVVLTDPSYKFIALQKWEGYVTELKAEEFVAQVSDITLGGTDETVEMNIEDVPEDDQKLIVPGAVFYWSIGYETIKGTRRKVSIVKFKRVLKIQEEDITAIKAEAAKLKSAQYWD